jgi:hypothetical protein
MPQTMPILNLSAENDIYYELIDGDPAKPWLVFLHEGLGCCACGRIFPCSYARPRVAAACCMTASAMACHRRWRRRQIHYLHDYALCELPQVLAAVLPGQDHFLVGHSMAAASH